MVGEKSQDRRKYEHEQASQMQHGHGTVSDGRKKCTSASHAAQQAQAAERRRERERLGRRRREECVVWGRGRHTQNCAV